MKILIQGDKHKGKTMQATCSNCQSVIEFNTKEDHVKLVFDQRDGDYYKFPCPVCSGTINRDVRP